MKLIYFYLGCNVPDSHCDDNLDSPEGGCARAKKPTHVATGPNIDAY